MVRHIGCLGAALLIAGMAASVHAQDATPPSTSSAPEASPSSAANSASLTLGGEVVLRLHGPKAQQRVDVMEERLTRLLATPDIKPADVVIYAPKQGAPTIYALGRRLLSADATEAKAAGLTPLALATRWAKKLQQILPRCDYRRPDEPEPVIPANPPLTVTDDFLQVGGGIGPVLLHDKVVLRLIGPQTGGQTAAERADALTVRLNRAADRIAAGDSPAAVQVVPVPDRGSADQAQLRVGGVPILTVTPGEAKLGGAPSPMLLASSWAKNIRSVLGLNAPPAPAGAPAAPSAPAQAAASPPLAAAPAATTPDAGAK